MRGVKPAFVVRCVDYKTRPTTREQHARAIVRRPSGREVQICVEAGTNFREWASQ